MALQLRSGDPVPVSVKLAGGAVVTVRPATMFEMDMAVAATGKMLRGLIQSSESAGLAADLLGIEFSGADFTAPEWIDAAAKRIILIELATTCVTEWSGFVDDGGRIIERPSRAMLALLLRSPAAASHIEAAMRTEVNAEYDEKNGSAASPNGGAAAEESIAPNAGEAMSPAPMEHPAQADDYVPKLNSLQ